jgi:hypothetical protein
MRYSPCTANASGKTMTMIGSSLAYVSKSCCPLVTGMTWNWKRSAHATSMAKHEATASLTR